MTEILRARARVVDPTRECAAWYSDLIQPHPHLQYLTGAFVEADRANSNGQFFKLSDLQEYAPLIVNTPMNFEHASQQILGHYVAAELIYPTQGTATARFDKPGFALSDELDGAQGVYSWFAMRENERGGPEWMNHGGDAAFAEARMSLISSGQIESASFDLPYVEVLAVWSPINFPGLDELVEAGSAAGTLSFSMECLPDFIEPVLPDGTFGEQIPYAGTSSPTYPREVNNREWARALVPPVFIGGALLLPGTAPGWSDAYAEVTGENALREVAKVAPTQEEPMSITTTSTETANLGTMTAKQFKDVVQAGLRSSLGRYTYVEDFDAANVWAEVETEDGYGYFQFDYAVDTAGNVSLSNPVEVLRSITWTPAPSATMAPPAQQMPALPPEVPEMNPMMAVGDIASHAGTVVQVTEVVTNGTVELASGSYAMVDPSGPVLRIADLAGTDLGYHVA